MPFYAEIVKATTPSGAAGWILDEGGERGVHVAPWMIKKEKEALFCSIVGFLKSGKKGLREAKALVGSMLGQNAHSPSTPQRSNCLDTTFF